MKKNTTLIKYLTTNRIAGNKKQAENLVLAGKVYIGVGDSPWLDISFDLTNFSRWSYRRIGPYVLIYPIPTHIALPAHMIDYLKENIRVSIDIDTMDDYYNSYKIIAKATVRLDGITINETEETGGTPSNICTRCDY
jgi:hypothetical protein